MKILLITLGSIMLTSCGKHDQSHFHKDGKVINTFSIEQKDILIKAINEDDYTQVEEIIGTPDFDIDQIVLNDRNALMEAVLLDKVLIAELLMSKGADPDFINSKGESANTLAGERENFLVISILSGDGIGQEYLDDNFLKGVRQGSPDINGSFLKLISRLKALLARGADINVKDRRKMTALIYATDKKRYELMSFLCSYESLDVDYKSPGRRGRSAMSIAERKNDDVAIEILSNCPMI